MVHFYTGFFEWLAYWRREARKAGYDHIDSEVSVSGSGERSWSVWPSDDSYTSAVPIDDIPRLRRLFEAIRADGWS
jgi:hypothetical protein